jgi:hypothetical protein
MPGDFTIVGKLPGKFLAVFPVVGMPPGNARRFSGRWEVSRQNPGDFTIIGKLSGNARRFPVRRMGFRRFLEGVTMIGTGPVAAGGVTIVGKPPCKFRTISQSLGSLPANSG